MLAAAFFSAAAAALTGSVWIGLASGIAASLALSAVHGLASITFRGNQLISGVAINFLAAGNDRADRAKPVSARRADTFAFWSGAV
jgi:simple sugar transport system permease protein